MNRLTVSLLVAAMAMSLQGAPKAPKAQSEPAVICTSDDVRDQDDMCIWLHPTDKSLSTVITADKHAHCLFVYDLAGKVLQKTPIRGAANIALEASSDLCPVTIRCQPARLMKHQAWYEMSKSTMQVSIEEHPSFSVAPYLESGLPRSRLSRQLTRDLEEFFASQ